MLRSVITTALVALLALSSFSAPAAEADQPLHTWRGVVTHVSDGDTLDVDIAGDGTSKAKRIRMTGIQAMEIGECHWKRAQRRLKRLVLGKKVRLSAVDPASKSHDGRLLRYVEVKRDGRWVDVNLAMLRGGHALWLPHRVEVVKHEQYHRAASKAAERGRRLWDANKCDRGPYAKMKLKVWAQSDADGNDFKNLNGEWIKIRNKSPKVTYKIGGWKLRDAGQNGYRLPRGTKIPPKKTLTVYVGSGTDKKLKKYMGRTTPYFHNVRQSDMFTGDGIYLFDKDGDLRAHFTYPCILDCTDKLDGKVELRVNYDADGVDQDNPNGEWVDVINRSSSRINVSNYLLEQPPYMYVVPPKTWIEPGRYLRVRIGKGSDTATVKYWGHASSILNNAGEHVEMRTFDYIRIDCEAWGNRRCPAEVTPSG